VSKLDSHAQEPCTEACKLIAEYCIQNELLCFELLQTSAKVNLYIFLQGIDSLEKGRWQIFGTQCHLEYRCTSEFIISETRHKPKCCNFWIKILQMIFNSEFAFMLFHHDSLSRYDDLETEHKSLYYVFVGVYVNLCTVTVIELIVRP
jgi:hypothetical protein